MKQILQNIQNRLSEITEIRYVDEDWGQLDYYSANMPVQWPCCLIDINSFSFSNLGIDRSNLPQNRQMGRVSVKITLANIKLTNSSMQAPQTQKDQVWFIWDLAQKIHEKLHGFSPNPNCSKMMRQNLQRNLRDDGIQEYSIMYDFEANNV